MPDLDSVKVCPRCNQPYFKIGVQVCPKCQPMEEAEYALINQVLVTQPGLDPDSLAEEAGVKLACVLRMLKSGRLQSMVESEIPVCGRCGAPAISHSKKLCTTCLGHLDQECADSMREMREALAAKRSASLKGTPHKVHEALSAKRDGTAPRTTTPIPAPAAKEGGRGGMVAPEIRRKGSR